jgi:cytochrome c biogenesis protein ResB
MLDEVIETKYLANMFSSAYTSHMYINSNKLRVLSPLLVTGILIYFERWGSHPSNDVKSNESNSPYP